MKDKRSKINVIEIRKAFTRAAIGSILVFILCILYLIFNPYLKEAAVLNTFKKDVESMKAIVQEWNSLNYPVMFINRKMYGNDIIDVGYRPDEYIHIDENYSHYFEYLFAKKKYEYIMKDDNDVYFTKYASFGNGYGVAFFADGDKSQNELIVSSKEIDNFDGWYFYIMR